MAAGNSEKCCTKDNKGKGSYESYLKELPHFVNKCSPDGGKSERRVGGS